MHLLIHTLLGAFLCLASQVLAFELTLYPNVPLCSAESDTTYRIISGPSNGTCINFDQDPNSMNLLSCAQYQNGGNQGPLPCSTDGLIPRSVRAINGPRACEFFSKRDCDGGLHQVAGERPCLTSTDVGFENYESFRCDWDDSVNVEGFVGCHDGVSSNVCVNDCGCQCLNGGQNMQCIPDLVRCSLRALEVCELSCVCVNP
ncbi:hypothetical protein V8F06_001521 [Rhypophila decipiens]